MSVMVSTSKGLRHQRSDTPILGASVFSIPNPPDERDLPECVIWREATIAWARGHYGDEAILGIYEHVDEGHQHLHLLFHARGSSVKTVMAGHAAVERGRAFGVPTAKHGEIYRETYRSLQDLYWSAVGRISGLLRISEAPRPRVTRQKHLAKLKQELTIEIESANEDAAIAKRSRLEAEARLEEVDGLDQAFRAREVELAAQEDAVARRAAAVEQAEADAKRLADELISKAMFSIKMKGEVQAAEFLLRMEKVGQAEARVAALEVEHKELAAELAAKLTDVKASLSAMSARSLLKRVPNPPRG